jgi:hypothetical protein
MAGSVSVVFIVEARGAADDCSDLFLHELTRGLARSRFEATLLIDATRAAAWKKDAPREFLADIKQMNLGLALGEPLSYLAGVPGEAGTKLFREREHRGFLDASTHGGHIPSAVSMRTWAPQSMEVISEWGTRVLFIQHGLIENNSQPYFLGGRLHVSNLGPYWMDVSFQSLIDDEGRRSLAGQIARRAEQLQSTGGVLVLRLAAEQLEAALESNHQLAASGAVQIAQAIGSLSGVTFQSARQMVDRWGDISYDIALATDFFRDQASLMSQPRLMPIQHDLGFLSPGEQLAALSRIWLESIQKGKAARNVTLRSPLPPRRPSVTDLSPAIIPARELESVLAAVVGSVDAGRLVSSVAVSGGRVAIQDLLPSLAGVFASADLTQPIDIPLVAGTLPVEKIQPSRWNESLASMGAPVPAADLLVEAQQFAWTYKPSLYLAY